MQLLLIGARGLHAQHHLRLAAAHAPEHALGRGREGRPIADLREALLDDVGDRRILRADGHRLVERARRRLAIVEAVLHDEGERQERIGALLRVARARQLQPQVARAVPAPMRSHSCAM